MKIIEEWNEDSPIDRWNEGRKELNKIIQLYNKWQQDGQFILNQIEAKKSKLSDYDEQLEEIKNLISEALS